MKGAIDAVLGALAFSAMPRGRKPHNNYIGRTNRNGTMVTRAAHGRLHPELVAAHQARTNRRAERWLAASPGKQLHDAPAHIRTLP